MAVKSLEFLVQPKEAFYFQNMQNVMAAQSQESNLKSKAVSQKAN